MDVTNLLEQLRCLRAQCRIEHTAVGDPLFQRLRHGDVSRRLADRMQVVGEFGSVTWIDDSKATNVGAALTSIAGVEDPFVLIAGGEGKGGDFSELSEAVDGKLRAAVLIGTDAGSDGLDHGLDFLILQHLGFATKARETLGICGDFCR